MSAPTRFLALAVFSWIGIRATAGMLDFQSFPSLGAQPPATALPALPMADAGYVMSPLQPGAPSLPAGYGYGYGPSAAGYPAVGGYAQAPVYAYPMAGAPQRYSVPVYYPYPVHGAMSPAPQSTPAAPLSLAELDFGGFGQAEEMPLSQLAAAAPVRRQSAPPTFTDKPRSGFDRLSLSSWAFIRQEQPQLIDLRARRCRSAKPRWPAAELWAGARPGLG